MFFVIIEINFSTTKGSNDFFIPENIFLPAYNPKAATIRIQLPPQHLSYI